MRNSSICGSDSSVTTWTGGAREVFSEAKAVYLLAIQADKTHASKLSRAANLHPILAQTNRFTCLYVGTSLAHTCFIELC